MMPVMVRFKELVEAMAKMKGAIRNQTKLIGDFELTLQSLNNDREGRVAGFSLRSAKFNPF
jgi:hypothetical protein